MEKNMILKRLLRIVLITLTLFITLACQKEAADPEPSNDPLQWQRIANFGGSAVLDATRFVIGNRAFVGTGVVGWNTAQTEFEVVADFWSYDPAADAWSRVADYGGGAVAAAIGFSINNQGYVGLGHGFRFDSRCDFWKYDPNTNTWVRKADFPGVPRHRGIGVAVGGKGYIVGGMSIDNGVYTARRDTWEYDPLADIWTRKADFPGEGRWGAAGFAIGTKVYVGLGEGDVAVTPSLWEYDTQTDTWTRKNDFPGRLRFGTSSVSSVTSAYLCVGNTTNGNEDLREIWTYDQATDHWAQATPLPTQADGRYSATAFALNQNLYVGLGRTGPPASAHNLTDFWRIALQ
jgi:N-acetylneuraminic acid mutarotase